MAIHVQPVCAQESRRQARRQRFHRLSQHRLQLLRGSGEPRHRRRYRRLLTAATPPGVRVRATARYTGRAEKAYAFEVIAYDPAGEIGLAGHWIKILLHHLFLHKARMRPGWRFDRQRVTLDHLEPPAGRLTQFGERGEAAPVPLHRWRIWRRR